MKRNMMKVVSGIVLALVAVSCGKESKARPDLDTVAWPEPDTVYRPWDKVSDDDFYKIPEDKRFMVEYDGGVVLIYAVNEDGESVNVYGGNPNGVEKLELPGAVEFSGKKYGVNKIAMHAFSTSTYDSVKWMAGVREIVVGEGIEHCGLGCFAGAPDLRRISFPSSLSSIGYCAMEDCEKLESVELPEDVKLLSIDDFAFMNCTDLRKFDVPSSVKLIGEGPWRNCRALERLTVAEGSHRYKTKDGVLFTISGRKLVQYPAGKKDREYEVESGVIEIENSAFFGNGYLEKVVFPNSLERIEHLAFAECSMLKEVKFNVGLRWIGNSAFKGCQSLKEVRLPGNTEYTKGEPYGYDTFPKWTKVRN